MKCEKCSSENVGVHDRTASKDQIRVKCRKCGHTWLIPKSEDPVAKTVNPKVGMSLNSFREKFDVEFIVDKTLKDLDPDTIYEKNDIIKLTGLRHGYPGLTPTIEGQKEYYGKVGSNMYFSHPDTIADLKNQAKLS